METWSYGGFTLPEAFTCPEDRCSGAAALCGLAGASGRSELRLGPHTWCPLARVSCHPHALDAFTPRADPVQLPGLGNTVPFP